MSQIQQKLKKILKVTFGQINDKNINVLRKLNFETFPVKYSTSFYVKIVTQYTDLSRFVYYNDIVIGAYTIRLENYQDKLHAYILTFGVLSQYRKYGIGRQMMNHLVQEIKKNHKDVYGIYLHMHVLNQGGKAFYQKCGLEVVEKLENYYTDLQQPHCYILRKLI